jgi:hypothetical protein
VTSLFLYSFTTVFFTWVELKYIFSVNSKGKEESYIDIIKTKSLFLL